MTIRLQPLGALLLLVLGPACKSEVNPALAPASTPQVEAALPQDPLERLIASAQKDNRAMKHLYHLTKEIGPRLTGSEHYDRAAQWCLQQFQSWGLSAHLETWGEFPVRCDRGVQRGREIKPEPRDLVFLTSAWTRGTHGAVRAPALLEPADQAELDAHREQYAGAWIVRRAKRPAAALRKAFEAALEGKPAAGFVARSFGGELLVMGGRHDRTLEQIEKLPLEIILRADQHEALVASLGQDQPVELEFEIENHLVAGPAPCTNVVADIVGSEFPDEYVIVGGHLDSWDGAEGAQDNGTGVASTLEAARLIAGLGVKPRRTLRFVLFGGEEEGLFGSVGYVKTHAAELPKISAVLIHDGGASPLSGLDVTYAMLADVQSVLAPLASLDRIRPVSVNERLGLVNSGDSDHATFLGDNSAPAFFWNQSGAGYDHVHHTQFDTFETVAPGDEEHNARVVAVAAFGLAQLDHPLERTDMAPLSPRRMGVSGFTGAILQQVLPDGRANMAGWQEGDELLTVDGVEVKNREDIVRAVNQGGPRKTIRLRRGSEVIDTELDWSNDPEEPERSARAGRREAWHKAHASPATGR